MKCWKSFAICPQEGGEPAGKPTQGHTEDVQTLNLPDAEAAAAAAAAIICVD